MKFRGVMIDAGPMREFTNIVTIISKLSKECVLRLSDDKLYFIVSEDNSGPAPPVLWCEIPQDIFFSEYQMIGIDEDHKDIYLGVMSANLAKSLVTLKSAKTLKMKLTKKQCPCLTLEIELPSSTSQQTRQVTHDIPVVVVPRKLWSEFHEPRVEAPDISIELPTLKQLRTTIDRMRTMAQEVVIRASAEGRLTLQIKTDMAKVSTRFKDLRVEAFEGPIDHSDSETETQANEDISKICHCRVDAKKFSMFLSADQISHNRTICSIVHKKLVILCLHTQENVKLQCFITGIVY
ncbi:checkpoint protein HUS1 [Pararge aegeria]|uniref:Checkpoint protein n=2 Tax=Pararge aegeria TaxID=116150 RepID=A0A8S4SQF5_9NEOP|nr:checkpoint protein HUS1 [Pararge aegeria]CAH2268342.1 jg5512 [Pararge aegeria aegeria]